MMLEFQPITRSWDRVWACNWVGFFFTADSSDVFLQHDVSGSKKTAQLLSVILKSNLQVGLQDQESYRYIGVASSSITNILCTLCNKSRRRACLLMRTENWYLSYTHLLSNQFSKPPQWPALEPERGRKKYQCFECYKWDHFHSTDCPHWCLQCEQVNVSHSL